MTNTAEPFTRWRFDNQFILQLPGDSETENFRRQVYAACYSLVRPKTAAQPKLVDYSKAMAQQLDLTEQDCQSVWFTQVMAGNELLPEMQAYASCYGGHQFGHWAGQLGDGRAINLGEIINTQGQRWALQLKGAGPTPYSRSADGLAVLRSSVREFLCSEAMYHLGVPTTRALSLVLTGDKVLRDMFYDGNSQWEPGAVVCRVAPSFTRFGHFQIHSSRQDLKTLKAMMDYTLRVDFPHLGEPSVETYLAWFAEVCRLTADMIVHWQRVGFVHGVMNTDNMSILGLTIDYGPYGWLDNYDPEWTPNTTDAQGRRYRFGHQPQIAYWNLVQLANAIYPVIEQLEPLQQALAQYASRYESQWQAMMASKLGLSHLDEQEDELWVADLLRLLQDAQLDMTLFYRGLSQVQVDSEWNVFASLLKACSYLDTVEEHFYAAKSWLKQYQKRLLADNQSSEWRLLTMEAVNPCYVLRNYLAQEAIDAAEQGDFSKIHALQKLLENPYQAQSGQEMFAQKRPDWAKQRAGCSMLSCSS